MTSVFLCLKDLKLVSFFIILNFNEYVQLLNKYTFIETLDGVPFAHALIPMFS